jgi:hypothetical protein
MPLDSYLRVYGSARIKPEDSEAINDWIAAQAYPWQSLNKMIS